MWWPREAHQNHISMWEYVKRGDDRGQLMTSPPRPRSARALQSGEVRRASFDQDGFSWLVAATWICGDRNPNARTGRRGKCDDPLDRLWNPAEATQLRQP